MQPPCFFNRVDRVDSFFWEDLGGTPYHPTLKCSLNILPPMAAWLFMNSSPRSGLDGWFSILVWWCCAPSSPSGCGMVVLLNSSATVGGCGVVLLFEHLQRVSVANLLYPCPTPRWGRCKGRTPPPSIWTGEVFTHWWRGGLPLASAKIMCPYIHVFTL